MKQPQNNRSTGQTGEELAEDYLCKKDFQILEKNFRCGLTEIDLIASIESILVFIEVKTRFDPIIDPERAVSKAKQRNIRRAAEDYLRQNPDWPEHRFDIISVELSHDGPEIIHFEDAFYPFQAG